MNITKSPSRGKHARRPENESFISASLCIVVGILFAAFCAVAISVSTHAAWIDGFNSFFATSIQSFRSDQLTPLVLAFTSTGNSKVSIALCAVLVILFALRKRWKEFFVVIGTLCVGILVLQGIKYLVVNPRPEGWLIDPGDPYSFPSAHSGNAFLISGCFGLFLIGIIRDKDLPRALGIVVIVLCIIYSILMGMSRIYVSVHWGTDVLAGWILGLMFIIPLSVWYLKQHPRC